MHQHDLNGAEAGAHRWADAEGGSVGLRAIRRRRRRERWGTIIAIEDDLGRERDTTRELEKEPRAPCYLLIVNGNASSRPRVCCRPHG